MKEKLIFLTFFASMFNITAQAQQKEKHVLDLVRIGNVYSKTKANNICAQEVEVYKEIQLKELEKKLIEQEASEDEIEDLLAKKEEELENIDLQYEANKTSSFDIIYNPNPFNLVPRYTSCEIYIMVESND